MISIIIVDDEEETREGLRDYIPWVELGIDVVTVASDGIEALDLAVKIAPDILITDVRMARMDGITFATKLRELYPFCKIIFISGYADKEYLKSAIHLKAISYVEKPLNLEEIQTAIKNAVKLHQEEKSNRATIEKVEHYLNQDIALELISYNMDLKNVKEKLSLGNTYFLNAKGYCTIIIKIREKLLDFIVNEEEVNFSNIVLASLNSNFNNYLIYIKENNCFVVHLCNNIKPNQIDFDSSLSKLMCSLTENVKQTGEIFITAGKWVTTLEQIKVSYQTSYIGLQQIFFKGYKWVLTYTETLYEPYIFDENSAEIFKAAIREGKKDSANVFIKNLTRKSRNCSSTSIDYIKDIYFNLAIQLEQIAFERGIEASQNNDNHREFLWKSISNKDTLIEIETYLLEIIEVFFQSMEQLSSNCTPIFAIKQYVQKYYYKQNLSISEIAEFVHLSPAYLCQIFKKETDVTINHYITEYRIEKAKVLLKDKQMKLIEIAHKTGYADANYFTRLFKKCTEFTPSEYREKYLL